MTLRQEVLTFFLRGFGMLAEKRQKIFTLRGDKDFRADKNAR